MTDTDTIREFINLKSRKKLLKLDLKTVEAGIERLEPIIHEAMINQGVTSITVDGKPVFLKTMVWVSPSRLDGDDDDMAYARACRALREAGLGDLVKTRFNISTVSSYIRELLADEAPIPNKLKKALNITEKHTVGVTGA